MERHFSCTACGKCCEGWLPLSIDDALTHADRFPLFLLFSTVRPGGKSYDLTAQLGFTLKLKKRKEAAVSVSALSYVPKGMACPALGADGLCTVHHNKPQRCRTMPLAANRAENDQLDLLIPKAGWQCDISDAAPVVYRDHAITSPPRDEFLAERKQMEADGSVFKPFAQLMMDGHATLRSDLEKVALRPLGGHVIVNFSTLVPRLSHVDIFALAAKQHPVMETFATRTADLPEYAQAYDHYRASADDWQRILNQ